MLRNRIIPCLLIQEKKLVKTFKFRSPKYVGDYLNAIKIFNEKEVDELIVLDISASKNNEKPNLKLIERFSSECFMPVCYGGGINSFDQAKEIFKLGIEKICIQTSALDDISIIKKISNFFGSQSVVISIDIKKNWLGKYKLYRSQNKKIEKLDWEVFLKNAVESGAGEILINCVDNDGTMEGMNLEIIKAASKLSTVPIISMGGVGNLRDIKNAINSGANAVAAGSFFVFQGPHRAVLISYPKDKILQELEKTYE